MMPETMAQLHDTMLFYVKSDAFIWNQLFQPYDPDYVAQYYRYTDDDGSDCLCRAI